jgi:hypothetical protein
LASHANQFISICPKQKATSDGIPPTPPKTQSADAPPGAPITVERREEIRHAASAVATLRHVAKRPWTGFIGNQRIRRDQRIILADGRQVFAFGARKGQVVWSLNPGRLVGGLCGEPWEWGVVSSASVRLAKSEPAAILGALKRGRREHKSEAKASAARSNGRCPCAPGKQRGRPRKAISAITAKPQPSLTVAPAAISAPRTFQQWVEHYSKLASQPQPSGIMRLKTTMPF